MPSLLTIVGGKAIHFRAQWATSLVSLTSFHIWVSSESIPNLRHTQGVTVEDSVLEVGFIGSSAPNSDAMPS